MYRATMSSTTRLANNAASYTPSPAKAQQVTAGGATPHYRSSKGSNIFMHQLDR